MPKWLDLNEVDDDEILLKKNRMSRSLVLDTPEVADAAEEDFLDTMEPAKKSMTIFFMIDVSGSMKGTKIGSLNSTMEELLPSLIGVGEASTDVKIAIMKFSTDVEWVTPEPVKIRSISIGIVWRQMALPLWGMRLWSFLRSFLAAHF